MESRPEIIPELHHRAAAWYERNGSMAEAVHHQFEAGDMDMAADVIGRAIKEFATWSKVEIKTFLEWLQALPEEVLASRPWLRLFASRSLFVTGDSRRAALTLEQLDNWLESNPDFPEAARLKGLVRADRASYAVVQGAVQEGITYAQSALDNLGGEDGIGRMRASAILGLALLRSGEVDASEKAFTEAIDLAIGLDLSFGAVPLICNLAEIQITQGNLSGALKSCERALELGIVDGQQTASSGFARLQKGKILYERNDLPAAESNMREALELLSRGGITESFGNVHALFALVQQALGYPEKAALMAQEAVETARQGRIERIIILAQAYQARIWLAQGSIGRAVHWADEYAQLDPTEYLKEFEDLTLARVLLASDQTAEAMALLDSLSGPAETMGRFNTVIQVRLLQGLAAEALGKTRDALDSVRQALISAEPEGYRRVFLDLGLPMAKLLSHLASEEEIQLYVSELLADFEDEANLLPVNQMPATIKPISQPSFLVEPLSGRELEVLHLLAKGHTNREIAQLLVLSTNTVRSHTYNIYGKLDVHSRTQAVARARELNMLESD
jgi:LuxR family maltose regulon positive regulatory protein